MLKKEIKDKILERSIDLSDYGIDDLAWHKNDALFLINYLINGNIGILGGDVYRLENSRLEPTYENWECETIDNESKEVFFLRSKLESLKYIANYPIENENNVLFSISFTEKLQ